MLKRCYLHDNKTQRAALTRICNWDFHYQTKITIWCPAHEAQDEAQEIRWKGVCINATLNDTFIISTTRVWPQTNGTRPMINWPKMSIGACAVCVNEIANATSYFSPGFYERRCIVCEKILIILNFIFVVRIERKVGHYCEYCPCIFSSATVEGALVLESKA